MNGQQISQFEDTFARLLTYTIPISIVPTSDRPVQPLLGIGLKLVSTFIFSIMIVLVKQTGDHVPVGEIVFFRSVFALVPVLIYVAWNRELVAATRTQRPVGHLFRAFFGVTSMALWFGGFARLPIADALAISYAAPLVTVALAAIMLGEVVKLHRWGAVALGFAGVVVILSPHLGDFSRIGTDTGATGALMAFGSAFFMALAAVQTSELTRTERTGTIVVFFSFFSAVLSLTSLPFGWIVPRGLDLVCLVAAGLIGGVGQLLLTSSYRFAKASTIAPLEYSSMIWAILFGFWIFGEVPGFTVLIGTAVVIGSGLLIVLRERTDQRAANESAVTVPDLAKLGPVR
jgi:drug/metabolite transporter (DMT)-like permease